MQRMTFLVLLGLVVCLGAIASGPARAECGDVNGADGVNISDAMFLLNYLIMDGAPPAVSEDANVDLCNGVDMADVAYLVDYLFSDGHAPCSPGWVDCSLHSGGEVSLASVDGLIDAGHIAVGEPVAFYLRLRNNTDRTFTMVGNGFRVYSTDGATWDDITVDSLLDPADVGFDIISTSMTWDVNGAGADTVGTAGLVISENDGLAPGESLTLWKIGLPAFDQADVGKTICLDSSWRAPGLSWKWSTDDIDSYVPSWDGPHCFTIAEPPDTRISVDDVHYADMTAGTIEADRIVTFDLRYQNFLNGAVGGITNGFRVFSPDGATWTSARLDSTGLLTSYDWDLNHSFIYYSADGMGADTLGIAAARMLNGGMPAGFDDIPYVIDIGPIDASDIGLTLCLDSCFFPPAGRWLWAIDYDVYVPAWSGPHCFEIVEPTTPVYELAVSPDTLEFFAIEGYPSPAPQTFYVEEVVEGAAIDFQCFFVESFIDIPDPAGTTPQSIEVHAWSESYPAGEYYVDIAVWSDNASNSPMVTVKMTIEEAPEQADSLILPSDGWSWMHTAQPVVTKLSQPIRGATIPLKIPTDVVVDSIVNTGLITEDWEYSSGQINEEEGYVLMGLANNHDATIPIGETEVFSIFFHPTWADCHDVTTVMWDTALSADPIHPLLFSDINNMDLVVGFDRERDECMIPPYIPGDIKGDGGVDIADLVYLVDFMFQDGPDLPLYDAADVNGTCTGPNIADLTYLVYYMFQDGPDLKCGCVQGGPAKIASRSDVAVTWSFENGVTNVAVASEIDLRGIQLELQVPIESVEPTSLVSNGWEMVHGGSGSVVRIGLLDLDGGVQLERGTHALFAVPGECQVVSALVSDVNHQEWQPTVAKNGLVPSEHALHQNYPNPFNPATEISFSLKQAADVRLDVYNIVGQLVTCLVDRRMEAGRHSVTWNTSGSRIASGVYFYRLTADDFTDTKKMLLLK